MPFTIVNQGSFVSTGASVFVPVQQGANYFKTINLTQAATTEATGVGIIYEWFGNSSIMVPSAITAANSALIWTKTNSTNAMNLTSTSTNGFNYFTDYPQPQAPLTGTTITNATPAVATVTNTYSNGDLVTIYGSTGMLQISGMTFSISSVSGSGFTLPGLPAGGFGAAATAFSVVKVAPAGLVEPRFLYITAISQATQAVVTTSINHQYVVGQLVHFSVPSSFGMSQINQLTGVITAVGSVNSPGTGYNNTFTVNINTSGFTAFAFPASSGSPTVALFATVAPAGQQVLNNGNYVPFHSGFFTPCMQLLAGTTAPFGPAGQSGDTIVYQSYKMEQ
jgi:hypothetical protein